MELSILELIGILILGIIAAEVVGPLLCVLVILALLFFFGTIFLLLLIPAFFIWLIVRKMQGKSLSSEVKIFEDNISISSNNIVQNSNGIYINGKRIKCRECGEDASRIHNNHATCDDCF